MGERLVLKVNGRAETVSVSGETPLLYVLRNDLGLNGPKLAVVWPNAARAPF